MTTTPGQPAVTAHHRNAAGVNYSTMDNYNIQPATGKADRRNRITHLFRHLGPGLVEHIGSYPSGSDAMRAIGMGNAHMVGYNREEVSVVRAMAGKYHPISMDSGPKARQEAERRAMVHEVHQRMNVPALCAMSAAALQCIAKEMNIIDTTN